MACTYLGDTIIMLVYEMFCQRVLKSLVVRLCKIRHHKGTHTITNAVPARQEASLLQPPQKHLQLQPVHSPSNFLRTPLTPSNPIHTLQTLTATTCLNNDRKQLFK